MHWTFGGHPSLTLLPLSLISAIPDGRRGKSTSYRQIDRPLCFGRPGPGREAQNARKLALLAVEGSSHKRSHWHPYSYLQYFLPNQCSGPPEPSCACKPPQNVTSPHSTKIDYGNSLAQKPRPTDRDSPLLRPSSRGGPGPRWRQISHLHRLGRARALA